MTRYISIIAFMAALIIAMPSSNAKMMDNGQNDRAGFFLGFGLGTGGITLTNSGFTESKIAFLSDFKIGGGISNNLLIMLDSSVSYTKINGVDVSLYTIPVALQWFPSDQYHWYIRPAVGFSFATLSTTVWGRSVSVDTDTSFGASIATGYEFRFGKYFALSPEFKYDYHYLRYSGDTAHAHSYGAMASMMWYF